MPMMRSWRQTSTGIDQAEQAFSPLPSVPSGQLLVLGERGRGRRPERAGQSRSDAPEQRGNAAGGGVQARRAGNAPAAGSGRAQGSSWSRRAITPQQLGTAQVCRASPGRRLTDDAHRAGRGRGRGSTRAAQFADVPFGAHQPRQRPRRRLRRHLPAASGRRSSARSTACSRRDRSNPARPARPTGWSWASRTRRRVPGRRDAPAPRRAGASRSSWCRRRHPRRWRSPGQGQEQQVQENVDITEILRRSTRATMQGREERVEP